MTGDPNDTGAISISNRQDLPVDEEALTTLAAACLNGEGASGAELSVSFVTIEEMTQLHQRYSGEEGPTDVLSFRMDDEEGENGVRMLGDVVIAPAVAAKANEDLDAELRLLLVHGILHLLGHDHENDDDKAAMWARQSLYVETRVP